MIVMAANFAESLGLEHAFGRGEQVHLNTPIVRGWMVGQNKGLGARKFNILNRLKATVNKSMPGAKLAAMSRQ